MFHRSERQRREGPRREGGGIDTTHQQHWPRGMRKRRMERGKEKVAVGMVEKGEGWSTGVRRRRRERPKVEGGGIDCVYSSQTTFTKGEEKKE